MENMSSPEVPVKLRLCTKNLITGIVDKGELCTYKSAASAQDNIIYARNGGYRNEEGEIEEEIEGDVEEMDELRRERENSEVWYEDEAGNRLEM
ncbi:hypothetical protein A2592_01485 [Candidatus Kaiserbacteria bacterium RIFOXYD1_FULL_42_15]|uniref:Uncharacterized protein n=1 Tax=Candidatus Kaiserbacteria bacterium RIFOXYD1_FULL_42_15 TaxID=1798532 RepID=A0A1F6FQU6_9BACT|nr:MAG: hypothetical protein A2592_01485 [Candidatus Kaiserbacteria bacterium RIFOXYD1_FULL_42_15]